MTTFEDAYLTYIRGVNEARAQSAKPYQDAGNSYRESMTRAWESGDHLQAYEAYLNYLQAVTKAMSDPEASRRRQDAYGAYVQALRDAWATVDPTSLDPRHLAAIAQGMLAVAACEAGAIAD